MVSSDVGAAQERVQVVFVAGSSSRKPNAVNSIDRQKSCLARARRALPDENIVAWPQAEGIEPASERSPGLRTGGYSDAKDSEDA